MEQIKILLFTGFLFGACQQMPLTTDVSNHILKSINSEVDSLIQSKDFDALSVGLIKDGKIYKVHKGLLLNNKLPCDETVYEIASLTKTFTGTLLANAIVDKKVNIDDDIRIYLNESFPNLEYEGKPITFRHLVTHHSGLPNLFPDNPGLFDNPDFDKLPFQINELQNNFSKAQFFLQLHDIKLDALPGEKFRYSNAGANLIGYILKDIYHMSYEELLKIKILRPLKMNHTEIKISKVPASKLAEGQNNHHLKMPFRAEKDMMAEGGILSTLDDMLKYMFYHLKSENTVVQKSHQELWNGKYGDNEAGLFWQINKNGNNPDIIFQNGGAFGASSWLTLIPEKKMGIFIITNISGPNVHQKLNKVVGKIITKIE